MQKVQHHLQHSSFDTATIVQVTLLGLWLVPPVISVKMQFWRFLVVQLSLPLLLILFYLILLLSYPCCHVWTRLLVLLPAQGQEASPHWH